MNISERITKFHKLLSENDLLIWQYIKSNLTKCEKMSIEELAQKCHVSKTTILRFTQRLGFTGYSEFKHILKTENKEILSVSDDNNSIELIKQGYNKYIDSLKSKDLSYISKAIYGAKNIYVHARGAVQRSVADELYRAFLPINKLIYRIKTTGETGHYEQNIDKDDVVIIISFSGDTEESIDFAKKLKLKGTKIIVITATRENELQRIANFGIYIEPVIVKSNHNAEYICLAEYFILIDVLLVSYLDFLKNIEGLHNEHR